MQQRTSWWARLRSWWSPCSLQPLGHLHFLVYTRRGCHLCVDAWQLLQQAQQRQGFQLTAVDIDSDAALTSRYGQEIPVVTVNGKLRFRGAVNPVLLERLFVVARSRLDRTERIP